MEQRIHSGSDYLEFNYLGNVMLLGNNRAGTCSRKKEIRPRNSRKMWKINCIHILTKNSLKLGFPTGRDSATFRDSRTGKTFLSRDKGTPGQKFLHCPGTKGQRDKLKILPRDGTGRDSQNPGRDGPGQ